MPCALCKLYLKLKTSPHITGIATEALFIAAPVVPLVTAPIKLAKLLLDRTNRNERKGSYRIF